MVLWNIFSCAVRYVLNKTYLDLWVGRGGATAWPPCSPDLNPLDFYLWGHLKPLVHADPVDNEEALHHRIVDDYQIIRNYPVISEQMWQSMVRRAEVCIYYKCTLSAVTHKLNVYGHVLI
ncbi:hypothetical protein B7P43_G01821 [Cryptotermes secundus]|uniref:Uncharacterized protein n=1 Tax=Cryptotermes secundus TaxID=105785 RepID=A0A2J7PPA2_9NEOP|nr:hypothetical protein B7P43_G01821 [Cryptotermes secundus]